MLVMMAEITQEPLILNHKRSALQTTDFLLSYLVTWKNQFSSRISRKPKEIADLILATRKLADLLLEKD